MEGHTESIAIASVAQAHGAEVVSLGTLGTLQCDSDQLSRQLQSTSKQCVFVYEAGPCGYGLSRSLTNKGDVCWVVAPSLILLDCIFKKSTFHTVGADVRREYRVWWFAPCLRQVDTPHSCLCTGGSHTA